MKKMVFGRKLSRGRKSREALFKSLMEALILHGAITTTKAKTKAVQGDIDKMITLSKKNSVASRRKVSAMLGNNRALALTVFEKISKAFAERTSGFTKIILLPNRKGDNAEMARLEWSQKISLEEKKAEKKAEPKTEPKKAAKTRKTTKKTTKKTKE
jgi:large subunit ribosomal protein L17